MTKRELIAALNELPFGDDSEIAIQVSRNVQRDVKAVKAEPGYLVLCPCEYKPDPNENNRWRVFWEDWVPKWPDGIKEIIWK